ncbi:MAG: zinc ribbon domain-containing protein [bacterium]
MWKPDGKGELMPIYEYRCKCGREVEDLRKVSEADAECLCPDCGARMERKLSAHSGVRMGGERGSTCCGRSEPCGAPPCADGACRIGD